MEEKTRLRDDYYARRSQVSAQKMELLTEQMHDIARKTHQDTVLMRTITVVTLFFLPGTFVSVSAAAVL